jgi:septal ring factor EnvC (AmiA/AmiB activator)
MSRNAVLRSAVIVAALLFIPVVSMAAPPTSQNAGSQAGLPAQVKDSDAKVAEARARNSALQAQLSQMEQRNAASAKQLQARDAEIAALQQKLRDAGVPVSASSAGHQP